MQRTLGDRMYSLEWLTPAEVRALGADPHEPLRLFRQGLILRRPRSGTSRGPGRPPSQVWEYHLAQAWPRAFIYPGAPFTSSRALTMPQEPRS